MKILVTVKEVAELEEGFSIEDGSRVPESELAYNLNEWDDYAIEEAVQAVEEGVADEVVTVTVGPERAEETIRIALAKGADRAVRVWDDALETAEFLDVDARAELLAAVVEDEDPDLILTGVQAGDDAFGATGVALAETVEYAWAAVVNEVDFEDDAVGVHRELEGGLEELTNVPLPAVLTIQTGINEPRYASLRGIRQASSKPLEVAGLADLGLDASVVETDVVRTSMYEPESESDVTLFEGDAGDAAGELATTLQEMGVSTE